MVVLLGVFVLPGGSEMATAGVGISADIGLPPLVFSAPPSPGRGSEPHVYAVPDIDVGLFF